MKRVLFLGMSLFSLSATTAYSMYSTKPMDYLVFLKDGPLKEACLTAKTCCLWATTEEEARDCILRTLMLNDTSITTKVSHPEGINSAVGDWLLAKAISRDDEIKNAIRTLLADTPDEIKWQEFDEVKEAVASVRKKRHERDLDIHEKATSQAEADEAAAKGRGKF